MHKSASCEYCTVPAIAWPGSLKRINQRETKWQSQKNNKQHLLSESVRGHKKQSEKCTDFRDPIKAVKGGESRNFSSSLATVKQALEYAANPLPRVFWSWKGSSCGAPRVWRGARKKSYFINLGGGGGPELQQCFSTRNNSKKLRISNSVLVKNIMNHSMYFFF